MSVNYNKNILNIFILGPLVKHKVLGVADVYLKQNMKN